MGKTKIIIEMPTMLYLTLKLDGVWGYPRLTEAIRNGTPLPKGHGDLVDFDRLCEEYWDGNYMEIHKDDLSNIKPIIEAEEG